MSFGQQGSTGKYGSVSAKSATFHQHVSTPYHRILIPKRMALRSSDGVAQKCDACHDVK